MKKISFLLVFLLMLFGCFAQSNNDQPKVNIKLISTSIGDITFYEPDRLNISVTPKRPEKSRDIFFCVPAAFTAKDSTIDGLFIFNGEIIDTPFNEKLNGACLLKNDSLRIISKEETDSLLLSVIQEKHFSFFQQFLLVYHADFYPCTIFKDKKNQRRALVHHNNGWCVAESSLPMTIYDFQSALIEAGVCDALYLDMGTWSEGWFQDLSGNFISIGEKFQNTHLQTNWLIYSR